MLAELMCQWNDCYGQSSQAIKLCTLNQFINIMLIIKKYSILLFYINLKMLAFKTKNIIINNITEKKRLRQLTKYLQEKNSFTILKYLCVKWCKYCVT